MKIGVISVQGAYPEHIGAVRASLALLGRDGDAVTVRRPKDLDGVDAVIIPGGESTTISKLLVRFGLHEPIRDMARAGVPIMGTCAGCILLAKEGGDEIAATETTLLGLMDMEVDRNAFGRQRESFETPLTIKGMDKPFPAVFIRAPLIKRVWNGCEAMATYRGEVVMARQDNLIAMSFHPELCGDIRIHQVLIEMV
jgi:pyridoxal 5'-phosphate synthase pdxT subunit